MALESCSKGPTLATLPPEILGQIVTHIKTARELCCLSLTCRRLHAFVDNDGFRVFAQTRFPYVQLPSTHTASFWRDAAHGLTTRTRNWDRKAFIAWKINPEPNASQNNRRFRSRTPNVLSGQTMGFIPVVDSYEAWYGCDWASRKEIVAWGAGADLVVRLRSMGDKAGNNLDTNNNSNSSRSDGHHHTHEWINYHGMGVKEGLDDITFVKLLRESSSDDQEQLVIGRASGGLELLTLSKGTSQSHVQSSFITEGRSVRSATINARSQSLLAACLSDSVVALYPLSSPNTQVAPVAQTSAIPLGQSGKTWTSQFLSNDRLAVGFGPAQQPIRIYNLGLGQLTDESLGSPDVEALRLVDGSTSVYALEPIAASSLAGGGGGYTFLSGAYDGVVRLHDVRSTRSSVTSFRDPVDDSPIYSLLTIGTERFVAGGARHSILKVFDLRMPRGKSYASLSNQQISAAWYDIDNQRGPRVQKQSPDNWNTFLGMGNKRFGSHNSPVYALSKPSECSPTLYAGLESTIMQIDIVSIMDRYPDPLFGHGPTKTGSKRDIQMKWDPRRKVACLPMYEHYGRSLELWKQKEVGHVKSTIKGWDERWGYEYGTNRQS